MILDGYYTTDSAAQFLGISPTTMRKLTAQGKLSPTKIGSSNVYHYEQLLAHRRQWYADGMSYREIGEKYGQTRTNVSYHFDRMKVEPVGVDGRRKGGPQVFSPSTVAKFARILGWEISDDWQEPPERVRCPRCGVYLDPVDGDSQITCECGQRIKIDPLPRNLTYEQQYRNRATS